MDDPALPSASDMRRITVEGKRRAHNPAFDFALRKVACLVREAARQRHFSVAYEAPEFVHGCPAFRVQDCVGYLRCCLEARGFEVQLCGAKVLIVSWAPPDGDAGARVPAAVAAAPRGVSAGEDRFASLSLFPGTA